MPKEITILTCNHKFNSFK